MPVLLMAQVSFTMLTPTFKSNNTPTSIENILEDDNLIVYPNPFISKLTVDYNQDFLYN